MTDTSTERLREKLDELGIEYTTWDMGSVMITCWDSADGKQAMFIDYGNAETRFGLEECGVTPEQAIAATLGNEENECYLMRDGKKFPVELDYGFIGVMPIAIKVAGFRYLVEFGGGI